MRRLLFTLFLPLVCVMPLMSDCDGYVYKDNPVSFMMNGVRYEGITERREVLVYGLNPFEYGDLRGYESYLSFALSCPVASDGRHSRFSINIKLWEPLALDKRYDIPVGNPESQVIADISCDGVTCEYGDLVSGSIEFTHWNNISNGLGVINGKFELVYQNEAGELINFTDGEFGPCEVYYHTDKR